VSEVSKHLKGGDESESQAEEVAQQEKSQKGAVMEGIRVIVECPECEQGHLIAYDATKRQVVCDHCGIIWYLKTVGLEQQGELMAVEGKDLRRVN